MSSNVDLSVRIWQFDCVRLINFLIDFVLGWICQQCGFHKCVSSTLAEANISGTTIPQDLWRLEVKTGKIWR